MPVNLTVIGKTDVGSERKTNEDAFVIADLTGDSLVEDQRLARFEVGQRGVLLAVSDGMGGHQAGEVASALVVESLHRSMAQQRPRAGAIDALLEKAARRANREVWEAAHVPGRENMGATLTAVFFHDATAYIAEVGDSRAYLVRNGEITQVTRDQTYVQLLVEAGTITAAQARSSDQSSVILQAMGLHKNVQVAIGRLALCQADCFVLCSDGLSSLVREDEIRKTVLEAGPLDAVCNRLVALAIEHGGDDNITVIVAGVRGTLPEAAAGDAIADAVQVVRDFQPRPPARA